MTKPWMCLDCRVMMRTIDDAYCKCPECGTEVWHKYGAPTPKPQPSREYLSRSLPEGVQVPGGSSKSGKRSKERMKKATLQTVNQKLYVQA